VSLGGYGGIEDIFCSLVMQFGNKATSLHSGYTTLIWESSAVVLFFFATISERQEIAAYVLSQILQIQ
jgi:hypothetical protein